MTTNTYSQNNKGRILPIILILLVFSASIGTWYYLKIKKSKDISAPSVMTEIPVSFEESQEITHSESLDKEIVTLKIAHLLNEAEMGIIDGLRGQLSTPTREVFFDFVPLPKNLYDEDEYLDLAMIPLDWVDSLAHRAIEHQLSGLEYLKTVENGDLPLEKFAIASLDCLMIIRNGKLINKRPENLAELIKFTNQVKAPSYGLVLSRSGLYFLPFVMAFGGDLMDRNTGELKIRDYPTDLAIRFYLDLINLFGSAKLATSLDEAREDFLKERCGIIVDGAWAGWEIYTKMGPQNCFIDIFPKGPEGKRGTPLFGRAWMISNKTKNLELAQRVISLISDPIVQANCALASNYPPALKKSWDYLQGNSWMDSMKEALKIARPFWAKEGKTTPLQPLNATLTQVLDGNLSPDLALDILRKEYIRLAHD